MQENVNKTKIHPDTSGTMFNEKFLYKNITASDFCTAALSISAIDRKVIFPKQQSLIGKVDINLSLLDTIYSESIEWYYLVK